MKSYSKPMIYKIFGVPGAGKTTFLITLVKQAIEAGLYIPGEIAFLSFTRAATTEAANRIAGALPELLSDKEEIKDVFPYFSTIHALSKKLLDVKSDQLFCKYVKQFNEKYRYDLSSSGGSKVDGSVFSDLNMKSRGDVLQAFWSFQRHSMLTAEEAYRRFPKPARKFMFSLAAAKDFKQRIDDFKKPDMHPEEGHPQLFDFDDLLEGIAQGSGKRPSFSFMIVDEAQDNSPLMQAVIEKWAESCDMVIYAGDPYQAIYTFQGADSGILLNIPGESFTLQESFRCPVAVRDKACGIIKRMTDSDRYSNDMFVPAAHQGTCEEGKLFEPETGTSYLLCRSNFLVGQERKKLIDNGILFGYIQGQKSLIESEAGQAYLTACRLDSGKTMTIKDLVEISRFIPSKPFIQHGEKKKIPELLRTHGAETVITLSDLPSFGFTREGMRIFEESEFSEALKDKVLTPDNKKYLRRIHNKYSEQELKNPRLRIGTIHSSKGKEADIVFINPEVPIQIRKQRNWQAKEHNTFYVALTRARKAAVILRTGDRNSWYRIPEGAAPGDYTQHPKQDRGLIMNQILGINPTAPEAPAEEFDFVLPF